MSLLREEVLRRRTDSLHGTISIAHPMGWLLISAALAAMVVAIALFLASASYARTETALGSVIPEGGILQIVPRRSGTVEAVAVTEGQLVKRGATLARIRVEETDGSGADAQSGVLQAIEQQDLSLKQQADYYGSASQSEQAQYAAQLNALQSEVANLDAQIAVQKKLIAMARSELAISTGIAQRGFISRRDLAVREEALLSRQQQLAALEQVRAAKVGALNEAERARRQAVARAAAAAAGVASSRAQVEKERAGTSAGKGYSLLAPADGRIAALSVHPGASVTPQDPAMMIVPAGGRLIARMYVPGKAAGFVRAGQEVRLAFEAYPYERFGTVKGRITAISSAPVLREQASGDRQPFYIAAVELPAPFVQAYGRRQSLLPGMTFTARIVTDRRSILQWLFDPIYAATRQ